MGMKDGSPTNKVVDACAKFAPGELTFDSDACNVLNAPDWCLKLLQDDSLGLQGQNFV